MSGTTELALEARLVERLGCAIDAEGANVLIHASRRLATSIQYSFGLERTLEMTTQYGSSVKIINSTRLCSKPSTKPLVALLLGEGVFGSTFIVRFNRIDN